MKNRTLRCLPGVYWLWYLYSFTNTGEGTTRKSRRDMVTEWATTGKRSHRRPRPWRHNITLEERVKHQSCTKGRRLTCKQQMRRGM